MKVLNISNFHMKEIVNNSDVNPKEVHYLGEIQPNSLIKCLKMIMR